jgi:hypothetical protein
VFLDIASVLSAPFRFPFGTGQDNTSIPANRKEYGISFKALVIFHKSSVNLPAPPSVALTLVNSKEPKSFA